MPRKLFYIFFIAVLVRVLFFVAAYTATDQSSPSVMPYLDGYYEIAQNLLAGNGFSKEIHPPFVPDSVRTPLYPLFIAGLVFVFESYYAVLIAQILFASLIPLLAYRIARQLLPGRERLANIVALILVFEPLTVHLSVTLMSEAFFSVLFLGGITFFLDYMSEQRKHLLVYTAVLLALATLARPTIQFLPLLCIAVIFFIYRKDILTAIGHSCIVVGVFLLILAPWSARNFVRFGNPALSVQYASVPYDYLVPSTIALERHIGFLEAQQEFNAREGLRNGVGDIDLANASEYKKRIMPLLLAHPIGLVKSVAVTALTFFTHDGYMDVVYRLGVTPIIPLEHPAFTMLWESPAKAFAFITPFLKSPVLFVIVGRVLWMLISLFFIIGVLYYLRPKENRAKGIFILLLIAYFVLTTVAVGLAVNARFRVPVNALILTFAVYGAVWIAENIRKRFQQQGNSPHLLKNS